MGICRGGWRCSDLVQHDETGVWDLEGGVGRAVGKKLKAEMQTQEREPGWGPGQLLSERSVV